MRFPRITLWHPKTFLPLRTCGTVLGLFLIARFTPCCTTQFVGALRSKGAYKNNQNVLSADEAFQLVAENVGIAFLTKASALRTRRPGIAVRPLVDKELRVELWLASRADNKSKLASEFVRAFMKRIEPIIAPPQMILPLGEVAVSQAEPMTAKRMPRSEKSVEAKLDARKVRSRKPKSQ